MMWLQGLQLLLVILTLHGQTAMGHESTDTGDQEIVPPSPEAQDLLTSPCLTPDFTWDPEFDIPSSEHFTSTLYECQLLCDQNSPCKYFTWNNESHPTFPLFCFHFSLSSPSPPSTPCTHCTSGPSTCTCSDQISCVATQDTLLDMLLSVHYEMECQDACQSHPLCTTYTWYSSDHPYHDRCFLYSQCSKYSYCDSGCHTGPRVCYDKCDSQVYSVLDDPTRSVNHGHETYCDHYPDRYHSPDWWGAGWFRFLGPDYTQLATYPPGPNHCGTSIVGWMEEEDLPSWTDGETEVRVCFQWDGEDCWSERMITVLNCSSYYVYHLPSGAGCDSRYCGM